MAKSLAAASEPALRDLTVPDDFSVSGYEITATRVVVPYVVFAQPKATEQWTELSRTVQGIQDGDQILVRPDPEKPVRLQPMRFTMAACKQYWVQKDPGGARVGVSAEQKPRTERWNEEVLAACIVYVQDGGSLEAVPASCVFKTTKCPAALAVSKQVEVASKPEWADESPAHKMAFAALAKPYLRVVGTVSVGRRTAASGFGYVTARAVVAPAGPAEWKALKDLVESSAGMQSLRDLSAHYKQRLQELKLA